MNASSWQEVLSAPKNGHHIVQVYQDQEFLTDAVGLFLGEGLRAGEGVVVIATPANWRCFLRKLKEEGHDPEAAVRRGQFVFLDAEATLATLLVDGTPNWDRFRNFVGPLLKRVQAYFPVVRAYGEMVNLLWREGRLEAAVQLEEHWNDLGRLYDFSLFCAYFLDNLDQDVYRGALQRVCRTHSHLIPARDYAGFEEAVQAASRKALGDSLADRLPFLAAGSPGATHMPSWQAVLLWLKDHMPSTGGEILADVRRWRRPS